MVDRFTGSAADPHGSMVRFSDYETLRAENERLTAELNVQQMQETIARAEAAEAESERLRKERDAFATFHGDRVDLIVRLTTAEARADKAAEDMRERAAKVADCRPQASNKSIAKAIRALASLPKESADA